MLLKLNNYNKVKLKKQNFFLLLENKILHWIKSKYIEETKLFIIYNYLYYLIGKILKLFINFLS